ncbi:hypothetical protein ASPCAL14635 [Aspergillus calidoustus]|uniref:BZIP domain-containing protein n=1 Tax=Aspergillus calidoustus TaxID=454130 RepID=A0A0U5GL20_ASPCI|nr:hypothetical protein ASPCAL14635 [Aspergillus calidoustus]
MTSMMICSSSPRSICGRDHILRKTHPVCARGGIRSRHRQPHPAHPYGENNNNPSKITKRQAQNCEAQHRFLERRGQERTHLLDLLQKLGAENDRLSNLLDQTRQKYLTLETPTKQLHTEADILRCWLQEMMSLMTGGSSIRI